MFGECSVNSITSISVISHNIRAYVCRSKDQVENITRQATGHSVKFVVRLWALLGLDRCQDSFFWNSWAIVGMYYYIRT